MFILLKNWQIISNLLECCDSIGGRYNEMAIGYPDLIFNVRIKLNIEPEIGKSKCHLLYYHVMRTTYPHYVYYQNALFIQ